MITVVVGTEIEKIKGEFESVISGMNMVGKIPYDIYSELFDVGTECIQKAYELGKSELEKENINRPKWHKVSDGDLPEEGVEVLNGSGVKVIRINGHWRYVYGDEWEDDAHPDYWCEVPQYTEE